MSFLRTSRLMMNNWLRFKGPIGLSTVRVFPFLIGLSFMLVGGGISVGVDQTVPVVFRVDMQHASMAPSDHVVLRGWGPWVGVQHRMEPVGASSAYRLRLNLPDSLVGQRLAYNFVLQRSDGTDQVEEGPKRYLTVSNQGERLPLVFFSDRASAGLQQEQAVTFIVDARAALFNEEGPEEMAVLGARAPLGWNVETDRIPMTESEEEGIWEATLTFPQGTPPDLAFSFAYQIDERWVVESLPGQRSHVVMLNEQARQASYRLRYDGASQTIQAVSQQGHLDHYAAIVQALGERGRWSAYRYFEALELLDQGQRQQARQVYEDYRARWEEPPSGDYFEYTWIRRLAQAGDLNEALAYCEVQFGQAVQPERKAYFLYLSGEVLLLAGHHARALTFFNRVLNEYSGERNVVNFSRQGAVFIHMQAQRFNEAIPLLEAVVASEGEDRDKQRALTHLVRAYEAVGDTIGVEQAEGRLAGVETPTERKRTQLSKLKKQLRSSEPDEALALLDATLQGTTNPKVRTKLLRLKSQWLRRTGRAQEARALERTLQ